MRTIRFMKWNCGIKVVKYIEPNNLALQLINIDDGSPIIMASVNPEFKLNENEIAIKSWAENDGVADILMKAGIISDIKRIIILGHAEATVHDLLITKKD